MKMFKFEVIAYLRHLQHNEVVSVAVSVTMVTSS